MDRRNGGTSLAPPRPPKSLPRVHRPRAPDPNASPPASAILSASMPAGPNHPSAMIGMMVAGSTNGAAPTGNNNGGGCHPTTTTAASATPTPPQLSPKPRHLIGGGVGVGSTSVLGSSNLSASGNDNSSNLASNISSNSNNNISNNNNINNNNNNNTIFMNNNPHNQASAAAAGASGGSNFNSASLISSRSNSSTSGTSNSTSSSSPSSRSNSNLNNNSSSGSSSSRSVNSQHHQHHQPHQPHHHHQTASSPPPPPAPSHHHHHHHQHNHPHQQSNRSIGSNSSTLSSVSSSSSTVALLRPQIAPLVPLHSRSATPPPLPPHHQRPTSPVGSTFARRRLSPATTSPHHHPHLSSIPLGAAATAAAPTTASTTTTTTGALPPVLLLPVDQPIVGAPSSPSNPTTPVTLAAPRPENERLANEYVDTPFGRGNGPAGNIPSTGPSAGLLLQQGTPQHHQQQHRNLSLLAGEAILPVPVITGQPRPTLDRSRSPMGGNSDAIRVVKNTEGRHGLTTTTTTTIVPSNGQSHTGGIARGSSIITKQPTKKKDGSDRHELLELELQGHHHHHHHHHRHHGRSAVATVGGASPGALGPAGVAGSEGLIGIGSITCPRCRRCRCEECQKPRPLPSHWLCDKSCLCSAETIIDYASCLCCVKALYYHCSKEHEFEREVMGPDGTIETETVSCADDPCSCVPHKRTTRWGCLGALSVVLPCLWCYWPMRGCVAICARCYAKHSRHGCRCTQHPAAPSASFPPGSALSGAGGILNVGSMFGADLLGTNNGTLPTSGVHEMRTKGDPADSDSPLQHLHHHLRHHLQQQQQQHHRSGASTNVTDLTTPEKRLLDSSNDGY